METTTYTEKEVQEIIRKTVDKTSPLFHDNLKSKMAEELFEEFKKKEPKIFYRVCNENTLRGLWYGYNGVFSGLIHNVFNFCKNKDLQMDFDPELVGWLSATDSIEKLFEWFPIADILALQKEGWYLHKFLATDVKFYDRFQHMVISQETSVPLGKIILSETTTLATYSEVATVKDGDLEVILIHEP